MDYRIVAAWRPDVVGGWPRQDLDIFESGASGEGEGMGHCVRAVGTLRVHAFRDAVEFPALDGRLAFGGPGECRDASLGGQGFVWVIVSVGSCLYRIRSS